MCAWIAPSASSINMCRIKPSSWNLCLAVYKESYPPPFFFDILCHSGHATLRKGTEAPGLISSYPGLLISTFAGQLYPALTDWIASTSIGALTFTLRLLLSSIH